MLYLLFELLFFRSLNCFFFFHFSFYINFCLLKNKNKSEGSNDVVWKSNNICTYILYLFYIVAIMEHRFISLKVLYIYIISNNNNINCLHFNCNKILCEKKKKETGKKHACKENKKLPKHECIIRIWDTLLV